MNRVKAAVILIIILVLFGWVSYSETHYSREATITEVNECSIITTDTCGYEWEFKGTGFTEGEKVILKMNTCFTNGITDDIIEDIIKD